MPKAATAFLDKPSVGAYEFQASKDNNIVWTGEGDHNFSPFKDGNPAAPPSERYKAVGGGKGLTAFVFWGWHSLEEAPRGTRHHRRCVDSLNVVSGTRSANCTFAIYRDFIQGIRSMKCATSHDFVNWTSGEWADYGAAPSEQLYTNAAYSLLSRPPRSTGVSQAVCPLAQAI